jgi:predicted nucleic acid-binding protein
MIYLDATIVFSLHFRDSNTVEALNLVSGATDALVVSPLCEMETVNAFALRVFRREMSERNLENAVKDLESDLRSGVLKPHSRAPRRCRGRSRPSSECEQSICCI